MPSQFRKGAFQQDRTLQIQSGFSISVFGLVNGARSMTVAPWGEIMVTQPSVGIVFGLRDRDGDGAADEVRHAISELQCPYGMAFRDGYLYVAQTTKIERFFVADPAAFGPAEPVASGFPQAQCSAHQYRPLAFDAAGNLFIAFGFELQRLR